MAVLDFGLKRIIEKYLLGLIVCEAVMFVIILFITNDLNELKNGNVRFLPLEIYLVPILYILLMMFLDKNIIRIEVKDSKLVLTGFQFFQIRVREFEIKEGMIYKITQIRKFRSTYRNCIRLYIEGIEMYVIIETLLNKADIDQIISFFKVNIPKIFRRIEE